MANSPVNESYCRGWVAGMEEAKQRVVNGDLSPQSLARIYPGPQTWLADAIKRAQALGLGFFAR